MRKVSCFVAAALSFGAVEGIGSGTPLAMVSPAAAQTLPAVWQNKAKKLTQAIAKHRQSLSSDGAAILGDDFKRKQFEDRIVNFRKNLERIPAADDPARNAAVAELALLETELGAAKAGGGAAAAPASIPAQTATEPTTPATPTAPATQQTTGPELVPSERTKLQRVMSQISKTRSGIRRQGLNSNGDSIAQAVKAARNNLQRFNKYDDPAAVAAREAFAALEQDVVDLQTLARTEEQLGTAAERMAELRTLLEGSAAARRPSALQDPAIRKQMREKIAAFGEFLTPFQKRTTPNAVAALTELGALTATDEREEQRADAQLAKLGDLSARTDVLYAKMKRERDTIAVPGPLDAPFTAERVAAWRADAAKAQDPAEANLAELNAMLALAYDSDRLTGLAAAEQKRLTEIDGQKAPIRQHIQKLRGDHNGALRTITAEAEAWTSGAVPESGPLFTAFTANDTKAAKAHIEASKAAVQTVVDTEVSFKMDTRPRTELIGTLGQALDNFDKALADGTLPEPKSTDAEMLAFAKIALDDDEEIGERGPVVLLSKYIDGGEYTHARSTVSDMSVSASGSVTGTVRTEGYTAVWKTFNFAVPIKTGDAWHLWKVETYNYSSSNTYPMGRWIVQKKTKGRPLPRSAFK